MLSTLAGLTRQARFSRYARLLGDKSFPATSSSRTETPVHATAACIHSHSVTPQRNFLETGSPCLLHLRLVHTSDSSSSAIDPDSKLPFHHPDKGQLIYTGKLTKQVKGLKVFSLSTSLLALVAQPLILSAAKDDFMFKAGLLGTFSLVIFSTPAIVHFVTRKYVTDIYFNKDTKKFTLATRNILLQRKEVSYVADDVEVPFVGGAFTSHIIKGRSFFIEKSEFMSKETYIHMVGYDKPMDLGIKDPNAKDVPKKKKSFGLWEEEEDKEKKEMKEQQMEERQKMIDEAAEEKKRMSGI